jgi:hypothetical protein
LSICEVEVSSFPSGTQLKFITWIAHLL